MPFHDVPTASLNMTCFLYMWYSEYRRKDINMTMKRLFSAVCVSAVLLTGCSSGPSKGDQMYEKYGKLIDALEAGNYEESVKAFTEYVPKPETEEVTLTKDNLYDYFELVVAPNLEKDAHGNIKSMIEYARLDLKQEYQGKANANDATIGYEYQNKCYHITNLNTADGSYTCEEVEIPADMPSWVVEDATKLHSETSNLYNQVMLYPHNFVGFTAEGSSGYGYLHLENFEQYTDCYVFKPETIDVISVTGTLTIRK